MHVSVAQCMQSAYIDLVAKSTKDLHHGYEIAFPKFTTSLRADMIGCSSVFGILITLSMSFASTSACHTFLVPSGRHFQNGRCCANRFEDDSQPLSRISTMNMVSLRVFHNLAPCADKLWARLRV